MFYKNLVINDAEYKLAVNISGQGAPTDSTEAAVGMFYMDENTGDIFKRTPDGWSLFCSRDGFSMWVAKVAANFSADYFTVQLDDVNIIDGRKIQLNDLILHSNGKVGVVVEVLEDRLTSKYTGINLTGKDGFSTWTVEVANWGEYGDTRICNKTTVSSVEGREIQVGDSVLWADGVVSRVTEVSDEKFTSTRCADLKGSDGLSIRTANVEAVSADDHFTFPEGMIDGIEDRQVQLNDTILFANGKVGRVVEIGSAEVVVQLDGINLNGKSAYAYAQEGGYAGTEKEFINALATISGSGNSISITDDGNGNVIIETIGSGVSITDDGNGNVVIQ